MGTTTEYKFPYPGDGDAPDGPTQIKALAEALDKVKWLEKAIEDAAITSRKLKLTSGVARSSASLALTAKFEPLAGTTKEFTPLVKSKLIVVTFFGFQCSGEGTSVQGTLALDGAPDANAVGCGWGGSNVQSNFDGLGEVYEYEVKAEKHTLQLQAKGTKGAGFAEAVANQGCGYLWFLHAV